MNINKNGKKILGLFLTLSVLVSLGVIGAVSANATAADTVTVTSPLMPGTGTDPAQGNIPASPTILFSPVFLIAPPGDLPGTVYVLLDGRVVTEMPFIADIAASNTGFNTTSTSTSAEVAAQFTVIPSRIVVVDNDDRIIEIVNNTCIQDSFYCLKIKELDGYGTEHSMTPGILESYNHLLNVIDWSEQGTVFPPIVETAR
jgi:hypothetical protein